MNCRVYLVRHGETAWNAEMRFQGHSDVALSEEGRRQALALAERLKGENFSGIYASDLERAYETAEIIARSHDLPVQREPGFREMNFGRWEGLTFQEIRTEHADAAHRWWKRPLENRVPGGESLGDLVSRSMKALYEICSQKHDRQVLIVSHGGVVRAIVSSVLGMDLNEYWRLKQDNLALSIIHFPRWDKGVLELFNDRSHL